MRRAASLLAWVAAIAAAVSAGAVASTFLPEAQHLPPAVTTISSLAAAPILFCAVLIAQNLCPGGLSDAARKQLLSRLPLPARRIALAVACTGWLISATTMIFGGMTGVPEMIDGRYALNNHGTVTFVTEAEYAQAVHLKTRIFSGGAMGFQASAVILAAAAAAARPAGE
jgi:hypothetical protein